MSNFFNDQDNLHLVKTLIQQGTRVFWIYDPKNQLFEWSHKPAELSKLIDLPEDLPAFTAQLTTKQFVTFSLYLKDLEKNHAAFRMPLEIQGKSGSTPVIIDFSGRTISKNGKIKLAGEISIDSSKRLANPILSASDWQLESIGNNINGALTRYINHADERDEILYANQGVYNIYGVTPEEALADINCIFNQVIPEDIDEMVAKIYTSKKSKSVYDHRFRVTHKVTGELKWVHAVGKPLSISEGVVIWDTVAVDITEQSKQTERLKFFETAVNNSNDAILITESSKNKNTQSIIFANKAMERLTGFAKEELIGQSPKLFQGAKTEPERKSEIKEALIQEKPIRTTITNYTKKGKSYRVELHISPIRDDSGQLTHFISVQSDVTQRELRISKIKQQNQKLSEIAWKQAHEVRAPLSRLMGIIHLFEKGVIEQDEFLKFIQLIVDAGHDLDSILHDMIETAHSADDLSKLLEATESLDD